MLRCGFALLGKSLMLHDTNLPFLKVHYGIAYLYKQEKMLVYTRGTVVYRLRLRSSSIDRQIQFSTFLFRFYLTRDTHRVYLLLLNLLARPPNLS